MKFIASKIHWIGIILLVGFTAAAAGLYFDTPSRPQKKAAPVVESIAAAPVQSSAHAGCNHSHAEAQKSEGGCGSSPVATAEESQGCCDGKKQAAAMVLPAGHPPIEGYTVAQDAHAGCAHGAEKAAENTAVEP
jgi:hypothetical protein